MKLIPADRPRSWVIYRAAFVLGTFSVLLAALPGAVSLSLALVVMSIVVCAVALTIGLVRHRYRWNVKVPPRPWKDQVW